MNFCSYGSVLLLKWWGLWTNSFQKFYIIDEHIKMADKISPYEPITVSTTQNLDINLFNSC